MSKPDLKNRIKPVLLVLLIVLLAVLFISLVLPLLSRVKESKATSRTTELVHAYVYTEDPSDTESETLPAGNGPIVTAPGSALLQKEDMINLSGLRKENPDVWCILRVPNTVIDYPVMIDGAGNDKYFDHDFFGNECRCGCIYTDKGTTFDRNNVLLYGHHMRNGEMFGGLSKYADKDYLETHKDLKLISDGMVRYFEVIGYFTISPEDTGVEQYMGLCFDTDYEGLEQVAREHGYLTKALEPGRKYVSLVTCEYSRENERAVVIAENTENISFGSN